MKTTPIPLRFGQCSFREFFCGLLAQHKISKTPGSPRSFYAEQEFVFTPLYKLTWLALAEDHAALSRSLEQLMALPRSVKVKRVLLVSLAAKFLSEAASARAAANLQPKDRLRQKV